MSDWEGPSTTHVIPPAPPAFKGPGPTPGPGARGARGGRGAPLWVLIVLVLAAAAVTGTAVYLLAGGTSSKSGAEIAQLQARNTELEKQVNDLTAAIKSAEASAAAAASATPPPVDTTTTSADTGKQFTFITKVTGSSSKGYQLVADYAQMLTGADAAAAATARGDESPPPNDYYILNDNKKLRTFPLSKTAKVIVLGWAGADATAQKTLTVSQFMKVMPGGASPQDPWRSSPYNITLTGGTVTRIEQVYLP